MRIAIGSDHRGFELKKLAMRLLENAGRTYEDFGAYSADSVDYPDIAVKVAEAVVKGDFDRGILICGTGIGMSIAANKVRGVRAAACCCEYHARMARQHNHANICCLGARVIGPELAKAIVREFVETPVSDEERHLRRCRKVTALETR